MRGLESRVGADSGPDSPYRMPVTSIVVRRVCPAPTLDSGNDESLLALAKRHGQAKLADTDLPVRAVLQRFAVVGWVTPRRRRDFVEFLDDSVCSLAESPSRSDCASDEGSHTHPSSLITRSEPLACLVGCHRSPLLNVLFGPEQGNEFVAVERGGLDGVSERVPNELAPAVEPPALPRVVDFVEKRFGEFEVYKR